MSSLPVASSGNNIFQVRSIKRRQAWIRPPEVERLRAESKAAKKRQQDADQEQKNTQMPIFTPYSSEAIHRGEQYTSGGTTHGEGLPAHLRARSYHAQQPIRLQFQTVVHSGLSRLWADVMPLQCTTEPSQLETQQVDESSGKPNHQSLIGNNATFDVTWPLHSEHACWHCAHQFTSRPIPAVDSYDEIRDVWMLYGNFCSGACAKAYMLQHDARALSRNCGLLRTLLARFFGITHDVLAAPPAHMLRMFGGTMEVEDFRHHSTCFRTEQIRLPCAEVLTVINTKQGFWSRANTGDSVRRLTRPSPVPPARPSVKRDQPNPSPQLPCSPCVTTSNDTAPTVCAPAASSSEHMVLPTTDHQMNDYDGLDKEKAGPSVLERSTREINDTTPIHGNENVIVLDDMEDDLVLSADKCQV